jgi:hypothetical protein
MRRISAERFPGAVGGAKTEHDARMTAAPQRGPKQPPPPRTQEQAQARAPVGRKRGRHPP